MTDLYLKPTQDGTGVRLHPANHSFFHRVNNVWAIIPDQAIEPTMAGVIFNAYHVLVNHDSYDAAALCLYLNTFLSGKRLVMARGCIVRLHGNNDQIAIRGAGTVPVFHNNNVNTLGVSALLNRHGLMPEKVNKLSAHYDGMVLGKHVVRVYVDGMLYCTIECEVK